MRDFSIHCQWESALHDEPEICQTSAKLKIVLGDIAVTRNEDEWSQTVRDDVRLSAYPLALWFAASWWRLRWEPLPKSMPSHSWRMAHELAAAGHGYLWPQMLFAFDGENVHTWAIQTLPGSKQTVRYLMDAYRSLPALDFELAIDEFISTVVARLDALGIGQTALHELWEEVLQERYDQKLAAYRRLEAMLGFDPDECPENLYRQFADLIPRAGASAVDEIASVCASNDPAATLKQVISFAESEGLTGRVDFSISAPNFSSAAKPIWQRAFDLAKLTRSQLGLNGTAVSDERLCDLLSLPKTQALSPEYSSQTRPPLGIAIRQAESQVKFLLSKRNKAGRRFELARLFGDALITGHREGWLPATDTKTARQKFQRAFAAEFLCPIESLQQFLGGDFSDDATEEAAEHFGVSTMAVQTHLVNNGLLPPEILNEYGSPFGFPYSKTIPASGFYSLQ